MDERSRNGSNALETTMRVLENGPRAVDGRPSALERDVNDRTKNRDRLSRMFHVTPTASRAGRCLRESIHPHACSSSNGPIRTVSPKRNRSIIPCQSRSKDADEDFRASFSITSSGTYCRSKLILAMHRIVGSRKQRNRRRRCSRMGGSQTPVCNGGP